MTKIKLKKCQVCGKKFIPFKTTQIVCDHNCALQKARSDNEKKFKAETRRRKQELKSRGEHLKEAQAAFNKFIRLRDSEEPCISCGRFHNGQYHAGHYRSVGSCPELRFEELNCHKQCSSCNNHLSGNLINYRKKLIEKIGQSRVDWLEGPHALKHYTIEDIKHIKTRYRAKARELEKQLAA